jgi:phospholipase/carboxylesterase
MQTHTKNILRVGQDLTTAKKAIIMVHGRGATSEDIIGLQSHLAIKDFAILAPQATNFTWYPNSFMANPTDNEPWLTSALNLLGDCVNEVMQAGISTANIYLLGFSQGACLTLEYATRNAKKYGGVIAFTGGLIGDKIYKENYKGDFLQTPIFIGSSDIDMHVPIKRVYASTNILKEMNANVFEKVYTNMPHTIIEDELKQVNNFIFDAK